MKFIGDRIYWNKFFTIFYIWKISSLIEINFCFFENSEHKSWLEWNCVNQKRTLSSLTVWIDAAASVLIEEKEKNMCDLEPKLVSSSLAFCVAFVIFSSKRDSSSVFVVLISESHRWSVRSFCSSALTKFSWFFLCWTFQY